MRVLVRPELEVSCDDVDVAVRLHGRTVLRVVEDEADELAAALAACAQVVSRRRAAARLGPPELAPAA